jgi:hypothetical protein
MELLLNEESPKIDHLEDINITLKDHQRAIIKKCIDIEETNICGLGIMSDKPGTGKTYAILGHIYNSKKKRNIIVVPQNIIHQWCDSIHKFSNGKLKYKRLTEYSDILELYNETTNIGLFDYDILITTSLYYNVISTTITSSFLNVECVFFDEIDSISSFVVSEINANFVWFVSASIDYNMLGIYTKKIDRDLIPYITCKCDDSFIDRIFNLFEKNIYKIICKNLYLDNIFSGILSSEEFRVLNAMDYSKLKKKFCNKIAQNEKEALDYLVKDKLDTIEIEKLRIEDINTMITTYQEGDNRINLLKKQLEKSTKSLEDSNYKLNLIKERLKEHDCCPLCYNEFDRTQKKVLSQCCKNTICYECANNWFNVMKKNNCIYCNIENTSFENYIILKPLHENTCVLCEQEYGNDDSKYYSNCCKKTACTNCLKEWYRKLLNKECLYCHNSEVLFEDFKNEKEHEETRLNLLDGVKYTRKTKIEFIEYFIKTKIYSNAKIIFCSNYIRIFNDIKKLFLHYGVKFIELDDGNIYDINKSVNEYKNGNINVLLLNSNLFGCGLNLECTTDILFLHKTESTLEKQIIGRAQRPGRRVRLNIWYIMHDNETAITTKKDNSDIFYNQSLLLNKLNLNLSLNNNDDNNDQYEGCTPINII